MDQSSFGFSLARCWYTGSQSRSRPALYRYLSLTIIVTSQHLRQQKESPDSILMYLRQTRASKHFNAPRTENSNIHVSVVSVSLPTRQAAATVTATRPIWTKLAECWAQVHTAGRYSVFRYLLAEQFSSPSVLSITRGDAALIEMQMVHHEPVPPAL